MTNEEYERTPGNIRTVNFPRPPKGAPRTKRDIDATGELHTKTVVEVPMVPKQSVDIQQLRTEATNPTMRGRSVYKMRQLGYSFDFIAEFLEIETPAEAKTLFYAVMSSIQTPQDNEIMRHTLVAQLEGQVQRSIAMASADYFEDADGNRYPNEQRILWHKELRQDIEVLARISGAQAAAQVQLITPEDAELDEIANRISRAQGHRLIEASVVELPVLDAEVVEEAHDGPDPE